MIRGSGTGGAAITAVLCLTGFAVAGCAGDPEPPRLSVEHPYIPAPAADDVAAGYLTVRNTGGTDDRLVAVTSDLTEDVTMHRTSGPSMAEANGYDIPAGGELRLARGGNHLMLEDLPGRPAVGDRVRMTLTFAESEPIEVTVPVREMTYRPPGERPGAQEAATEE